MLQQKLITAPVGSSDETAFEELYRTHFVRLFRFCFSIIHQKEPAEEIVHDVFLNFWQKTHNTQPTVGPAIDNPGLYLYISVRNRSLNFLRDKADLPTVELSERCDQYLRFEATPESLLLSTEAQQRLLTAINQLPPRCKLIFTLIKEDGLKYKEVARLLDLSVKTVEAQLSIALRKLADAIPFP